MSRWEPNTRGRLEQVALELYLERGFERTTVAEITARAGLTERTFFRHFADKREVLFAGSVLLRDLCVGAIAEAPEDVAPIDAVFAALRAAADGMQERQESVRRRQVVIDANSELQERELIKLAALSAAMTEALVRRGVSELAARVTAEAGMAVFKIAFERWVGARELELPRVLRECFDALRDVTAGG
ncbi:Transcriptional regulator, TetR family [Streptomyces sp. YIM 130001]|uniref:TetR family transcriptional regulator n=1 Tax=Streptomyces sp. YIM 130001 TaxID=2259644 RepID=UPI000E65DE18|nr:TetR family transcriptional regulator [Streptomyces sp. YIM 130001]RII19829.1 Transcriptional regulator, TetR family [Streptomyces sp. YIM 130001]